MKSLQTLLCALPDPPVILFLVGAIKLSSLGMKGGCKRVWVRKEEESKWGAHPLKSHKKKSPLTSWFAGESVLGSHRRDCTEESMDATV